VALTTVAVIALIGLPLGAASSCLPLPTRQGGRKGGHHGAVTEALP